LFLKVLGIDQVFLICDNYYEFWVFNFMFRARHFHKKVKTFQLSSKFYDISFSLDGGGWFLTFASE